LRQKRGGHPRASRERRKASEKNDYHALKKKRRERIKGKKRRVDEV